jgi:hypothetical protein
MKYSVSGDASGSGTVDKKYTNDDYGLLIGIGFLISVGDNSTIDLGFRSKWGFPYVVDAGNMQIKSSTLELTVGFSTYL